MNVLQGVACLRVLELTVREVLLTTHQARAAVEPMRRRRRCELRSEQPSTFRVLPLRQHFKLPRRLPQGNIDTLARVPGNSTLSGAPESDCRARRETFRGAVSREWAVW